MKRSRKTSWLGIDFHVMLTLMSRSWSIVAGALTILILPHGLNPAQQGYYFTFASLLALQVFFELGLGQVIVQLVAHEAAHLSFNVESTVVGDKVRVGRLFSLIALLRRWYAISAILFAIIGSLAGVIFFAQHGQAIERSEWVPVWCTAVVLNSINLYLSPMLAVVEGAGLIGQVARLRLIQSICGYGAFWFLLMFDAQLWAALAVPFVAACMTPIWLRLRADWLRAPVIFTSSISWRYDVFPLQWRIAVSWACGYFLFSLFTPVVFATHGPVEAGRIGMTMSIFSAVMSVGLSWVNAKAPELAKNISRNNSEALNNLFWSIALRATVINGLLCYVIVALTTVGSLIGIGIVERIATPMTLFWVATASTINTAIYAAATYMRAHREEPMMPASAVSAAITVIMLILLKKDISEMMMGYAFISIFISLPWTYILLKSYLARHSNSD